MVIQQYEDKLGQVRHSNILSRPSKITSNVKQGCVIAPALFTLLFRMMLQKVTENLDDKDGVYICFLTYNTLKAVHQFSYLGRVIKYDGKI